jgi:hypothetical protein
MPFHVETRRFYISLKAMTRRSVSDSKKEFALSPLQLFGDGSRRIVTGVRARRAMRDTVVGIVVVASGTMVSSARAENDSKARLHYDDQTWDEMMAGSFTYTIDSEAKSATAGEGRRQ